MRMNTANFHLPSWPGINILMLSKSKKKINIKITSLLGLQNGAAYLYSTEVKAKPNAI